MAAVTAIRDATIALPKVSATPDQMSQYHSIVDTNKTILAKAQPLNAKLIGLAVVIGAMVPGLTMLVIGVLAAGFTVANATGKTNKILERARETELGTN